MSKHYSKADEEKRKLGHVHENAHDAETDTEKETNTEAESDADVEQDSKSESHHEGHATDNATVDEVETNTDDALKKAFGRTSKVTNTRYATVKKWTTYGIGALGLLALLLIFVGHHHNEENKKEEEKKNRVEKAGAVLIKRLDEIQHEKNESPIPPPGRTTPASDNGAYSKELIARMNAPTSLYEGGNNASVAATASKNASDPQAVPEATFIGKGADQAFGNTAYATTSVDAKQVPHPEATIVSGEMIHATLNVASNSDLPGMVTATVSSPAYSYTGDNELIPRGSRLIGQYSSAVLQGQDRIFIMWNRLVLPNGTSVDINSPDTDQIGQAGEPADYINRHFWSRFGESILLSILSAGVSNVDVQSGDQYNSAQAYRMGIADSLQASATGSLQQTISTKPTLIRYQGSMINVFIAHDLSFYNLMQQTGQVV